MKKSNIILSLLMIVLSCYTFWESLQLKYTMEFTPGPGFLLRWISILILLLTVPYLIINFLQYKKDKDTNDADFPFKIQDVKRVAGIIILITITIFLMDIVGFVLSMTIFMLVSLKYFEKFSWKHSILYSILISYIVFFVFANIFGVDLPRSFLEMI